MNASIIFLVTLLCITAFVLINRALIKEEDLIKKAEKNFFYHVLAKMTSSKYEGYIMDKTEKKVMEEYISHPSEYDTHSIGSYFKLSNSLKSTLRTCGNFHNYSLNFNLGEVGTGFMVFIVFAVVVTLGVIYG